ncbi:YceI family protein [Runella slithyformis]|uniref:YceI family protein n=1 Tax=Runella slithyformis (strain ATCC 29530 / DSM 19594 / LMG 11500 / NCIMB 11436 / LSU 4) TaxID=761193 RepID=A0A7U4E898_RUNSL|nr:YceI family protein [Runella slithyformis]AEI51483.1 YceI family protein [Runella slithyformis DSM 19594]
MKTFLFILAISAASLIQLKAQNLFSTSNGETSFFSETPVENITAVNKFGQAILNTSNNEIVVQLTMKQFDFPNKLMQEHFNENYIESDKYPKALFKGKINESIDFTKNGAYDISATGDFTLHGVTKPRTLKGKVTVAQGAVSIASEFDVALADHNIEVPKIVFMKIAQTIKVKSKYNLAPYVGKK